jgi:DNA-binding NarL/FixJ family response regulator
MQGSKKESPTVLVVDDSELARESVKHSLGSAGINVIGLSSPFGFIKLIRDCSPNLILVDVGLGTMNGTRLVQLGRQHAPEGCCILLYSSREDGLLAADVSASGADGFISKKTTGPALVASIKRWLVDGPKR